MLTSFRSLPATVPDLAGVAALEAGDAHTCAIAGDGSVKCWGANGDGQLGDGTQTNRNRPVAVQGLSNGVRSLSAGGRHTCAVTVDNVVTCWGDNQAGQLGNGLNGVNLLPADVNGLTGGVAGVAAGSDHTCAAVADGTVKCWGIKLVRQAWQWHANQQYAAGAGAAVDRSRSRAKHQRRQRLQLRTCKQRGSQVLGAEQLRSAWHPVARKPRAPGRGATGWGSNRACKYGQKSRMCADWCRRGQVLGMEWLRSDR